MTATIIDGLWPDMATARFFLSSLIRPEVGGLCDLSDRGITAVSLANWLITHELAPLAYARLQQEWPSLRQHITADWYAAAAENQLHQENLIQIVTAFAQQEIPVVISKGSVLAQTVYPDPACRPMSDIDLWVDPQQMERAVAIMTNLGFITREKVERPTSLQALSGGEIAFRRPDWVHGLVELHWSPLGGWWLYHTAVLDTSGMWQRRLPLTSTQSNLDLTGAAQLDPEDTIIQVAVHIAVNHQLSGTLLRSLADIALVAANRPVNWQLVAVRAKQWRVATAVYTALTLTHHLFDLPASEPARRHLQPNRQRRWLLSRLVNPHTALNRADIRTSFMRQLLLLLLVDRPVDIIRLIGRTLWPTAEWREARYGQPTSSITHIQHLLRQRQI